MPDPPVELEAPLEAPVAPPVADPVAAAELAPAVPLEAAPVPEVPPAVVPAAAAPVNELVPELVAVGEELLQAVKRAATNTRAMRMSVFSRDE